MRGRATLTTVPSRKTMPEPRMAAAGTQRGEACPREAAGAVEARASGAVTGALRPDTSGHDSPGPSRPRGLAPPGRRRLPSGLARGLARGSRPAVQGASSVAHTRRGEGRIPGASLVRARSRLPGARPDRAGRRRALEIDTGG